MNDAETEIITTINNMAGKYSSHEIFSDWVKLMALSIQNGCTLQGTKTWQTREQEYINTIGKYDEKEADKLHRMFSCLLIALEEPSDILGEVFMHLDAGSSMAGQFFTPFTISLMTAEMSVPGDIDENSIYKINEPACGGGCMIIAAAVVLKRRGVNFQKCMDVIAQDVDWRSVHMTYVQLSLLGIKARVIQGNTLAEPYTGDNIRGDRVFITPAKMGLLL